MELHVDECNGNVLSLNFFNEILSICGHLMDISNSLTATMFCIIIDQLSLRITI
jgi:hypothetical protein